MAILVHGIWGIMIPWVLDTNRHGKGKNVWHRGEYGVGEVWIKRESTVPVSSVLPIQVVKHAAHQ